MGFGEKLKAARKACGYTQQQIADLMKIDKSTYCGYETGKRQPDVQKIKQLADLLGVSGDILLETGYEKAPTLTKKDERDIAKSLESIMADLEHSGDLMFDGDPMTEEARQSMRNAIELGLKAAKLLNKETYNPNKNKKG